MSNDIRVIYILNSSTKYGGANKSLLHMLEGLKDKGVIPFLVLPRYGELCSDLDKRKIKYCFIPCYLSVYPPFSNARDISLFVPRLVFTLFKNYYASKKLIAYVQEIKPNIIHSNVGPVHIGYIVAKKLEIPHVWHIREYQDLGLNMHPLFSMNSFIRKLHSPNNFPIAISHGIYNYYSLDKNAKVINNPVYKADCIQFNPNKKKYFLFAGRLEENKRIKDLIVAFSEFEKINFEYLLYIAGDTPDISYKNSLFSMIERMGINEKVKFLGMIDDISDLMAQATAVIVPSRYEGFGRITAEAMFNGCLVIGNNSGGTKEILEKDNLGILYSDHEELVAAMKKVVSNGIDSYYPMIKKAQERAVSLYSVEQNVSAVYNLYQEILIEK